MAASPKTYVDVAGVTQPLKTYDLTDMSAPELTKALEAIRLKKYDLIILNFANGDMVGHTGVESAASKRLRKSIRMSAS
jgi:bisphosphoglycerate-independent phosphoglycerate mutase (AlkP superfamily)